MQIKLNNATLLKNQAFALSYTTELSSARLDSLQLSIYNPHQELLNACDRGASLSIEHNNKQIFKGQLTVSNYDAYPVNKLLQLEATSLFELFLKPLNFSISETTLSETLRLACNKMGIGFVDKLGEKGQSTSSSSVFVFTPTRNNFRSYLDGLLQGYPRLCDWAVINGKIVAYQRPEFAKPSELVEYKLIFKSRPTKSVNIASIIDYQKLSNTIYDIPQPRPKEVQEVRYNLECEFYPAINIGDYIKFEDSFTDTTDKNYKPLPSCNLLVTKVVHKYSFINAVSGSTLIEGLIK